MQGGDRPRARTLARRSYLNSGSQPTSGVGIARGLAAAASTAVPETVTSLREELQRRRVETRQHVQASVRTALGGGPATPPPERSSSTHAQSMRPSRGIEGLAQSSERVLDQIERSPELQPRPQHRQSRFSPDRAPSPQPRPPSSGDAFRRGGRAERTIARIAAETAAAPSSASLSASQPAAASGGVAAVSTRASAAMAAAAAARADAAPPQRTNTRMPSALDELRSFVNDFEVIPEATRVEVDERITTRRANVDRALAQAREASVQLQELRASVVEGRRGPFDEDRERSAMLQLVHALALSHQQLMRRYQELQMDVAVARALEAMKPVGVSPAQLEETCPALTYEAVLRGSVGSYSLPGDGECAVCQSDFEGMDRVRLLPCKHTFHCECIDPWLAKSTCCPTCRGHVVPEPDATEGEAAADARSGSGGREALASADAAMSSLERQINARGDRLQSYLEDHRGPGGSD